VSRVCEPAETKKKATEEGGTRRGRIQLEPSGTSGLCLGITRHPVTKIMLYLCDNQALLKAVKRWVGEGRKATLVGAPDADISLEAIDSGELRKRTTAGAATFLEYLQMKKLKSRRGTAGCGRRLDEDQQTRRCANTGIV